MTDAYADMSPEQLATDPDFQTFVSDGRKAAAWEARFTADPGLSARAEEARRLIEQTRAATGERAGLQAAADRTWDRIAATTGVGAAAPRREAKVVALGERTATGSSRRRRFIGVALATAAAVLALLLFLPGEATTYRTGPAEILVVTLPDGSRATLAPASRLTVDQYAEDARALELDGEAFFEVARGGAFTVATDAGEVAVLGTSFAVSSFGGFEVACATGRVRVTTAADAAVLTAGRSASASPNAALAVDTVPVAEVAGWREGRLTFRDEGLDAVTAELGRFYGRDVALGPEAAQRRLTIELPSEDFPAAVERLGFVLQLPVDTSAGGLRIR